MASRLTPRPPAPPTNHINNIDNYDVDDDDPFAESGDDVARRNGGADTQSKKRKDASGLGIDEAVSVSKKPRLPRVKLDETRLLSDNGIPKLRNKARGLKFKGKGHEFSDTARLLSFYQLWLDDLFPKAKFLDALSMVEKAGHKNQLRLKRIQWIDEGRPRPVGLENDDDIDDDLFSELNQPEERDPAIFPARVAPIFQSGLDKRAKTPARDDPFDEDIYGASPKRQTNVAVAAASVFGSGGNGGNGETNGEPDEDGLDALMAEEEAQRTASNSLFGNGKTTETMPTRHKPNSSDDGDDGDDLDVLIADAEAESSHTRPMKLANRGLPTGTLIDDGEDDLDALMAEAEVSGSIVNKPPSHKLGIPNTEVGPASTQDVDEDEEAAMAEMEGLW
ncbi:replication fork protection component Swi3-domain-containing protein [Xylaria sp. FL1777]|nr:replication fork protection component Swi3-domain-containing protein [Xylaria sp. FL1777]